MSWWFPSVVSAADDRPPNIVLILCDNLGYGDIGCYGSTVHRTPNIDRLAAEGLRFTHAYVASGVCSPSRAALMTGCYPRRVNLDMSENRVCVLQPVSSKGLNPDETTVAEVLKRAGYATMCIGKWHLGDQPAFLPTRQGFDSYLGIPYSDDMYENKQPGWPPVPLMRDERVIDAPVDLDLVTQRYTEAAVTFIDEHRDQPFFLYLPHATPGSSDHPPASERFRGKSANGLWGDSVEEIDWSTGQILDALARNGIEDRTLVLWTNDNGAPKFKIEQGTNLPLKGWGYDVSEGSMRTPLIARWPGHVPAAVTSDEVVSLMDVLPTVAQLASVSIDGLPTIDGRDISPLLLGQSDAKSPHEAFYYYLMDQLQAVRAGPWKLYLPLAARRTRKKDSIGEPFAGALFNLVDDPQETKDLLAERPEIVARLEALADQARADIGDVGHPGRGQRPAGHEPQPTPRKLKP